MKKKWGQQKEFKQDAWTKKTGFVCKCWSVLQVLLQRLEAVVLTNFYWISGGFQYQPGSFQPSRLQCFLGQEFLADCGVCQRAPAHAAPQAWLVLTDVRHVTVWLEFQHQQQMIESLCFGGVGPVAGGCLTPAWDWPVLQTLLFLRSLIMRFVSQI